MRRVVRLPYQPEHFIPRHQMKRLSPMLLLTVAACATRPDLGAERAAIIRADSAWLATVPSGNIDSIVSFWTDDARVIAPGQRPRIGRAAIRQMVDESSKMPGFSVRWETTDVVVAPSGDVGYSFGTNVFTMPGAASRVDTLHGQAAVVWRKGSDGRWRAAVDIWTPQAP
jgi:ketosteroid isomerase-like protein